MGHAACRTVLPQHFAVGGRIIETERRDDQMRDFLGDAVTALPIAEFCDRGHPVEIPPNFVTQRVFAIPERCLDRIDIIVDQRFDVLPKGVGHFCFDKWIIDLPLTVLVCVDRATFAPAVPRHSIVIASYRSRRGDPAFRDQYCTQTRIWTGLSGRVELGDNSRRIISGEDNFVQQEESSASLRLVRHVAPHRGCERCPGDSFDAGTVLFRRGHHAQRLIIG